MSYRQRVQLQDHEGDVVAEVELPAHFTTPRVIVLDGVAFMRKTDLLVYRAIAYLWIGNEANAQRLVDQTGELKWQTTLH